MDTLLNDLRVGLRLLWRDKAFTFTAAATLAICIGANTALFSVVYGILLKPLGVPEADHILIAGNQYPGAGINSSMRSSIPNYVDRLRETDVFEAQAIFRRDDRSIDQQGVATRVAVMNVTPSFFRLLRVEPQLGRAFTEQEGEPGNEQRVVLSYAFWQSQFGGDPKAVGSDLRIDGRPHTIVGVMPQGFKFVDDDTLVWKPMAPTAEEKSDDRRHSNNVSYIARLKPGATLEQARAQIDAINAANLERFPADRQVILDTGFHTVVKKLQEQVVEDVRSTLYLMWAGALFVLLIGCVNVANLVLVRSRARLKELATRLALGAGTHRIAQQLVVENLLLAVAAAVAGLAVGSIALRVLGTIDLDALPRASDIRLDAIVTWYTLGLAGVIGLVLGLIPVAAALRANLVTVMREEGRTGTSALGARALRRGLVVAQVACAFVLLIGAGLLFASFRKVLTVNPGFAAEQVLTAAVSLPKARYADADAIRRFTAEALRRLRALPGVRTAGATDTIPFGNSHSASGIMAEGSRAKPGESVAAPSRVRVSNGYFEAIGARLVKGRFFDENDAVTARPVAIIDERLARRFWPDQDPIGRHLFEPADGPNPAAITDKTELIIVVGVIGEIKMRDLTDGDNLVGAYYLSMAQGPDDGLTFAIRTTGNPAALSGAVRRAIAELDSQLPVFEVHPMAYWTERALASRRSPTLLAIAFGAVALFLSAVGIYGVLAYLVTKRTKEIGIRVALGSSAAAVYWLVLREGLLLIGAGLLVGGAGAAALGQTFESQLFGVTATDPIVLLVVGVLLAAVALTACAVPARRATKIDPVVALAD